MENAALLSKIQSRFPEALEPALSDPKWVRNEELQVRVPATIIAEVAAYLKNDLGYDFLNFVTAVDWSKNGKFEMVYHFLKSEHPEEKVFVKAELPRDGTPTLPTLSHLWDTADWQEREVYDMFGIHFDGHKDLRRILLWEGYSGYPLRKDYVHIVDRYDNGQEIGVPKPAAAAPHAAPAAPATPPIAKPSVPPAPPASPPSKSDKPGANPQTGSTPGGEGKPK